MANSFGIGFVVGATLAPTVSSVFSTVEQKIQSTSRRMEALSAKASMLGEAQGYSQMREHANVLKQIDREQFCLETLNKSREASQHRSQLHSGMMGAVIPMIALAAPFKAAMNFESAMADAAKTIDGMRDSSGKLTPQYYEMETAVKKMGREIPLTHEQIAGLFAAGGQQGMTGVDELQDFTKLAAHMSVAFGMSTEAAADAIGGYRSAMHLSLPETRSMLDLMNQFANTTSATEQGIAEVVRRIGPLGNVGGIAAKPMTALAATLDAMKVAPEVAATGIKNLILAMTAGSAATKTQQQAFAQLGIDTVQLAKDMQENGSASIISVLEKIKALPKDQQLSILQQLFGKESLGAIAPLLDSLDTVKDNLAMAANEMSYLGATEEEFKNRTRTTASALITTKNRVSELGITLGSVMLPALVSFLEAVGPVISVVADFASKHQTLTTVIVGSLAGFMSLKVAGMGLAYIGSLLSSVFYGARGILGLFVPAVRSATIASTALAAGSKLLTAGQWLLNAALTANPIGLVVVGVAALAGWFAYAYNEVGSFTGAISMMWDQLKAVVPGLYVVEAAFTGTIQFIRDIFNGVSLYDAGVNLLGTLSDGFMAAFDAFSGWFTSAWDWLMTPIGEDGELPAALTAGNPPVRPATPTTEAVPPANVSAADTKLTTEKSQTPRVGTTGAANRPANGASGETSATPAPRASTSSAYPAAPGNQSPAISMNFHISGITDNGFTQRLMDALRQNSGQFERIIADIVHNQERLAHG